MGASSSASSGVLELGVRGTLDGRSFTLEGRTSIRGRRGVTWNEWSLRFDDGRVLFLADAAGGFTIYEESALTPSLARVIVGAPLDTGFVVVERGEATRVARWGVADEAPARYTYVDLSGRAGELATIDFGSEPPRVFVGRRVTLAELGIDARSEPRFVPAPEVSRPKGVETWLEPGDTGEIDGTRYRVLGMISRSTGEGGEGCVRWDEYLLFAPDADLRWLVVTDGHWSLVEPVDAGRVEERAGCADVVLDGVTYELLSEGVARVDWATGELPWEIAIGDTSSVKDFVHPPWILTREHTDDELTWSRARHVATDVIAKAFGKRSLPRPEGRAPNQL